MARAQLARHPLRPLYPDYINRVFTDFQSWRAIALMLMIKAIVGGYCSFRRSSGDDHWSSKRTR